MEHQHAEVTYEQCKEAADYIQKKSNCTAKVAVVCGLNGLADNIDDKVVIPYSEIPNFPKCCEGQGHAQVVYGHMAGTPVIFLQGRYHFFEGYSIYQCVMPIRVLKLLGIETLIITSSAAGVNSDYKVGDFMLITDHINLLGAGGKNPLIGHNDERWGPRFLQVHKTYDKDLLSKSKEILNETKYNGHVHEGVYIVTAGPTYKTKAENNFFKTIGADAVGMSVVPEVLVAKHCGMNVVAMSLIVNAANGDDNGEGHHTDIAAVEGEKCNELKPFIEKLVQHAGQRASVGKGCKCKRNE